MMIRGLRLIKGNRIFLSDLNKATLSRNFAVVTENVPILGESITEGAIAAWEKNVGEGVGIDDVVAIIETDKVSVEIKSPFQGVLVEQMAAVDDDVTVGAPLYKLDTEGEATTIATPAAAAPADAAPPSNPVPAVAPAPVHSGARVPLIKFLGKRSLLPKVAPPSSTAAPVTPRVAKVYKDGGGVPFHTLGGGALFGRPVLSEAEIEAIESGVSPELEKLFPAPVKKGR